MLQRIPLERRRQTIVAIPIVQMEMSKARNNLDSLVLSISWLRVYTYRAPTELGIIKCGPEYKGQRTMKNQKMEAEEPEWTRMLRWYGKPRSMKFDSSRERNTARG